MTVFNISETRHDKKKSGFNFKIRTPKLAKNSLKKPQIHTINFLLFGAWPTNPVTATNSLSTLLF